MSRTASECVIQEREGTFRVVAVRKTVMLKLETVQRVRVERVASWAEEGA